MDAKSENWIDKGNYKADEYLVLYPEHLASISVYLTELRQC